LGDLDALQELLSIRPDFAAMARTELEEWFSPDLVQSFLTGLRKAGLDHDQLRPRD
jgi:hypothetical protein